MAIDNNCNYCTVVQQAYLNGSGVSNERAGHLEAAGRDVTNGRLHVVGDPFHKVGGVLVLDVEHLFINFLHAHAASED